MSVLITGVTGFVGAHVARLMTKEEEKDITIFDINPSTRLIDDIAHKVTLVRGDLGNFSHVLNVVSSCRTRTIFHLGGMLSVPSDADHAAMQPLSGQTPWERFTSWKRPDCLA